MCIRGGECAEHEAWSMELEGKREGLWVAAVGAICALGQQSFFEPRSRSTVLFYHSTNMFLSTGIGLALLLAIQSSVALPHVVSRDLNSFVDSERATALQGILANIGPDGSLSMGADAGVGELLECSKMINDNTDII